MYGRTHQKPTMIPLDGRDAGVVPKLLARVDIGSGAVPIAIPVHAQYLVLGLSRSSFPSLDEGDEVRGVVDVLFEREKPVAGIFEPSPATRWVIHSVA
jgi:hypothetical protein